MQQDSVSCVWAWLFVYKKVIFWTHSCDWRMEPAALYRPVSHAAGRTDTCAGYSARIPGWACRVVVVPGEAKRAHVGRDHAPPDRRPIAAFGWLGARPPPDCDRPRILVTWSKIKNQSSGNLFRSAPSPLKSMKLAKLGLVCFFF
jgi:hypothetical protein